MELTRASLYVIFTLLHEEAGRPALHFRIVLSSESCKYCKEGTLSTCCKVVNYLQDTYATSNFTAEMDAQILCLV